MAQLALGDSRQKHKRASKPKTRTGCITCKFVRVPDMYFSILTRLHGDIQGPTGEMR